MRKRLIAIIALIVLGSMMIFASPAKEKSAETLRTASLPQSPEGVTISYLYSLGQIHPLSVYSRSAHFMK